MENGTYTPWFYEWIDAARQGEYLIQFEDLGSKEEVATYRGRELWIDSDAVELDDLQHLHDCGLHTDEVCAAPVRPRVLVQADQNAQSGRVDEGHVFEVEDDILRTVDQRQGLGLHVGRAVQIEIPVSSIHSRPLTRRQADLKKRPTQLSEPCRQLTQSHCYLRNNR